MAPTDDADARGIDVRIPCRQHADRGHDVVDLAATVVDRVVEHLAVADAAAIFRRNHDVAFARCLADERNVILAQVTANALVHPDKRGVALRPAQPERLEYERGNVEIARLAAVGDLLHLHEAFARGAPRPVGVGLLPHHVLGVGPRFAELALAGDAGRHRDEPKGERDERA